METKREILDRIQSKKPSNWYEKALERTTKKNNMKENFEIQYTVKILSGEQKDKIVNRVFTIEEIENDGIASWLTNHGYYFRVQGRITDYIEIIDREFLVTA